MKKQIDERILALVKEGYSETQILNEITAARKYIEEKKKEAAKKNAELRNARYDIAMNTIKFFNALNVSITAKELAKNIDDMLTTIENSAKDGKIKSTTDVTFSATIKNSSLN